MQTEEAIRALLAQKRAELEGEIAMVKAAEEGDHASLKITSLAYATVLRAEVELLERILSEENV